MMKSKELAHRLAEDCMEALKIREGEKAAVLVNGLGSTSREELFILFHDMSEVFDSRGVKIVRTYVGEYVTSMEMAGCSLSVLRLDDELEMLMQANAYSPFVVV